MLCSCWGYVGDILDYPGLKGRPWIYVGPSWAHLGPILGPCWAYVGPCWLYVGPMLAYLGLCSPLSSPYVGPMLAYVGPMLTYLGAYVEAMLAISADFHQPRYLWGSSSSMTHFKQAKRNWLRPVSIYQVCACFENIINTKMLSDYIVFKFWLVMCFLRLIFFHTSSSLNSPPAHDFLLFAVRCLRKNSAFIGDDTMWTASGETAENDAYPSGRIMIKQWIKKDSLFGQNHLYVLTIKHMGI